MEEFVKEFLFCIFVATKFAFTGLHRKELLKLIYFSCRPGLMHILLVACGPS